MAVQDAGITITDEKMNTTFKDILAQFWSNDFTIRADLSGISFNSKLPCNGIDIVHCQDAARTSQGIYSGGYRQQQFFLIRCSMNLDDNFPKV